MDILALTGEDPFPCTALLGVNLEAGRVTRFRGGVLFGSDGLSSMVVLGDVIYMLGGLCSEKTAKEKKKEFGRRKYKRFHLKASRFNLNLVDFDGGWRRVSPYQSRDFVKSCCVVFDDKIYVFGGFIGNCADGTFARAFGEVYDPALNQWTLLPPLKVPKFLEVSFNGKYLSSPVLVDSKNHRIIVHLAYLNSLYAYYPDKDEGEWVFIVYPFPMWTNLTVFFDNMIINHINGFKAYDLVTNKWLNTIISPDFPADIGLELTYEEEVDALIPMEPHGTFCLATWFHDNPWNPNTTFFIFLKFSVQRNASGDALFNFISSTKLHTHEHLVIHQFLPIGKIPERKNTCSEVSSHFAPSSLIEEVVDKLVIQNEISLEILMETS